MRRYADELSEVLVGIAHAGELDAAGLAGLDRSSQSGTIRGGSSPDQVAIFREFDIPHPLDQIRPTSTPAPAPAPAPTPVAANGSDRIAAIERLADLHRSGALSEQEFQTEKARLLGS